MHGRMVEAACSFEQWLQTGSYLRYSPLSRQIGEEGFNVFVRVAGRGPWLTLLHGFPTSSLDYAPLLHYLEPHFRILTFDFLGFGGSDKPTNYHYNTFERADVVQALWKHFAIGDTLLVAHDFANSVVLELLARELTQAKLSKLVLLNGGLYSRLHRPVWSQKALLLPLVGPLFTKLITRKVFERQFASLFGRSPRSFELEQAWRSIEHGGGRRNYHKLIGYITDRIRQSGRWEPLLARLPMPTRFIWGAQDPVSGEEMIAEVRRSVQNPDIVMMANSGHYPHLEEPKEVARAMLEFFR